MVIALDLSCAYLISWLIVRVCAPVCDAPHIAIVFAGDWSKAAVCSWSKRNWGDGVVSNVSSFFFLSTNHRVKYRCLQLSYVRRTEPLSDDESCQRHPLHSESLENNIASEPFVAVEQWFYIWTDFRWSDSWKPHERRWILTLTIIIKKSSLCKIMTHRSVLLP